ncbi:hypothetical protein GCM10009039_22920 [Halocalculus aciditolerans]|uniref:site-specific DNA-methyltransferase (adenine-specific) n=2 Tax=Halocalculus aciditolerans TaxID=1383812 RepID=A0A830F899_9EURY|nr:hypothetical protein GCM10009039_22920 [Halocalculus aciditolerans]
MSTTHGQPGLSSDQRSTIRSTILRTRHTLEDELRRQLERYGIYENKRLPLEDLSHLSAEDRHTRRTLDAAIERELESTEGDLERSITNYVREATKTYLNRFVALKTIEVRGLVEETITERPEYGNRSYMHHTVAEIAGELTNAPDDGFGAALDLAYQEIGAEIRMIFEESEHSAIDLDAQVREEVLDELDAIDDEVWERDEALGWVYQYFGEEEREEIDDRVDEENYKIAGTDIATKTQLFTPRYIVEWMVDNSLGRTWLEMQGERTNIDDEENCFYLAPLEDSLIDRETKAVEDITVLDPACGSGHMLFYAFDVLYQMYLEEGEVPEEYIPREILRHNLYGIDIDSGAAQIAALSLYLKAKEESPDVTIPRLNIVSADAVLINGDRKQEVLERARSELEEEILEQIWRSFDNIREFGSLVRVEERIDEILEKHKDAIQASGQVKFTQEGSFATQSSFVSGEGEEESWEQVKDRLLEEVGELASEALDRNDPIEEMFAEEVGKSVEILDLLVHEYEVVVSNPPYLSSGKMGEVLKQFVKDNYIGSRDLYTAFIERNSEFVVENGYVSMITMETFMYQYSYRKMRPELLKKMNFVDVAHLENRDQGYMNVCFSMRKYSGKNRVSSRFNRLVNLEDKIEGLQAITEANRKGASRSDVFLIEQDSFEELNGHPFTYWLGNEVLSIYSDYSSISSKAEVLRGLDTGDDERFVRKYWEISPSDYNNWKSYLLSPTDLLYHEPVRKKVLWGDDGSEIKEAESSIVPSEDYFFKPGLIFRRWGDNYNVKLLPADCIASKSPGIYPDESVDTHYLLGYLNSSLVRYIMKALNPSLNFGVTDTEQIPVKFAPSTDDISKLAQEGANKQEELQRLDEINEEFDPDQFMRTFMRGSYRFDTEMLSADIEVTHGLIDYRVFEEYDISDSTIDLIYNDVPLNIANYNHIANAGELDLEKNEFRAEIQTEELSEEEYKSIVDEIDNHKEQSLREISETLEISPYSVAMIRRDFDLYTDDEKESSASRLLSYYLGCAMGRWSLGGLNPATDGIIPFGSSYDGSVMDAMRECIKETSTKENAEEIESEIKQLLGRDVEEWLRNRFFRYHHCKEYRRRGQRIPIYWQLASPDGAFSCFVYYHEIDSNTLPKLRGQYLDPRINELENELETLNAQTKGENPKKELLKRKEEVQNDLEDVREFRETIDEMIDDGVTVDVEKGIWENVKEWDQYEVLETGLPKLKSSYSR